MLEIWQNLPTFINPIAFQIGFFVVRWYSLMWMTGIIIIYFVLKKEKIGKTKIYFDLDKLMFYLMGGIFLGGRLGYALFYNFNYYFQNPTKIFNPFSFNSEGIHFEGLYGMSYFGGLVGALIAGFIFARRNKLDFFSLADLVAPVIPLGYFFGRVGNFLNGELFGRITTMPWGMNFGDGVLRHPSQLYEAAGEGILLFFILNYLKKRSFFSGHLLLFYIFFYSIIRFILEFFRQPDLQKSLMWNFLTFNQVIALIFSSFAILFWLINYVMIKGRKNLI